MKNEFIKQYAHTWGVFERIAGDFSPEAWIRTGRGVITPARLAFHILKADKYYIEDTTVCSFPSGKSLAASWEKAKEEDLPSQKDILGCVQELQRKTEAWLSDLDFDSANTAFPWAGGIKGGVALFLLRHMLYHLGELSSLLNESKNGVVEDHYVKA